MIPRRREPLAITRGREIPSTGLPSNYIREESLQLIFDQLSDAVFVYDRDLYITGVNQASQSLFSMTAAAMVGKRIWDIVNGAAGSVSRTLHTMAQPAWLSGGIVHLRNATGRERVVVVRTVPLLDDAGEADGAVAIVEDITGTAERSELLSRQSGPRPSREACKLAKRQVVGESQAMRELMKLVERVAASEATSILLEGENGTGKDVIATALHELSWRQPEPFLAINCAAIPETLLESELFGYERGAFTGARAQKPGLIELAGRGTLFLDEIGEIAPSAQVKLLRVLEEQTFRRLGGLRDIKIDLRIIAATNRNLRDAVSEGTFRQDLYYRLNVIHLVVPPLRQREQDIQLLANFFIDHYNLKFRRDIQGLSPDAGALIMAHNWPGNVRELRNAIECAMILEDTSLITPPSLPAAVRAAWTDHILDWARVHAPDSMSLPDHERCLLAGALARTGGNKTKAAGILRITRDRLRYKMKKLGIEYRIPE